MEVDLLEDMHAERALAERQVNPGERDRRDACAVTIRGIVHEVDPWEVAMAGNTGKPIARALGPFIW
jgi:hypothetical protein